VAKKKNKKWAATKGKQGRQRERGKDSTVRLCG